jgi:hypothetical protein
MPWILEFVDAAADSVDCHRLDIACRLRGDEYRMHCCLEPAVRVARAQHMKAFRKLGDMVKV